jgi:acyl carrier protein
MNESIKQWLIDWFVNKTSAREEDLNLALEKSYFEAGWIDSLLFISFISDVEEHFKVSFSNDEFQNREFSTILGLADIITEKKNNH